MALIIKCRSCRTRILEKNMTDATLCPGCGSSQFQFIIDYRPRGRYGSRKHITLPETVTSFSEAKGLETSHVSMGKKRHKTAALKPCMVNDLFPDYLKWYHGHKAESTWHDVSRSWENDLKPFFGEYEIQEINVDHYTLYQQMRAKHVKNRTVNKELDYFSGFLRWCRHDKKMQLARIEYDKLQADRMPPIVLSPDEVDRIMTAALSEPVYHALFLCLYSMGLRSAEARNLRWEDIDAANMSVRTRQKGGTWKILPMNEPLAAAIETLRTRPKKHATSPYVFCVRKSGKQLQNVRKAILRICARAGVTKAVHPHLFRHSIATHLVGAQQNLKTIQELLGHSQISTTAKLYTQVGMADLRKAQKSVEYHKNTSNNG